ncbi:hypothetical protein AB1Y20_011220 [Prymnesium parvum]|uniref:Homeobox domain-containing protein n=1 Tax=Prymnesium parvum TaxID=97485 RepID=A0AB34IL97_PRYPA
MATSLNTFNSGFGSSAPEQQHMQTNAGVMAGSEQQQMNSMMPVMSGFTVAYPTPYVPSMQMSHVDALQQQQMMQAYIAQQQHMMHAFGQHDPHSLGGSKQKSPRWIITRPALFVLEQVFTIDKFPSHVMRQRLAQELGVTPRQVQVWFQNRRQRERSVQRNPNEVVTGMPSKVSAVASAAVAASGAAPPPIACASIPTIAMAEAAGEPAAEDTGVAQPATVLRQKGSAAGQPVYGQSACAHPVCGQPNGTVPAGYGSACTPALGNGVKPAIGAPATTEVGPVVAARGEARPAYGLGGARGDDDEVDAPPSEEEGTVSCE